MSLSKNQFSLLRLLESQGEPVTQRELAALAGKSVGTVNKALSELRQLGYIRQNALTDPGREALEPYRARRAVFIAAGFGSRLVPITLNTPKPLVRVHGKRIIDGLLDAVAAAGIDEVYIVRGYLAEQFDVLLRQYPHLRFIENPDYNEANNISSVMYARHLLEGAYVFEADLLLYNPSLVTKYQYGSNYLGISVDKTDDWCFHVHGRRITDVGIGGSQCYQMVGISYWTAEDGARLSGHVRDVYQSPGGRERYWDQVPLQYYAHQYNVSVRPCSFEDIVEIDTYRELKALDKTYGEA